MRKTPLLQLSILLILWVSCSEVEEFKGIPIRQYADFVIKHSSQYSAGSYSANQVLDEQNVYDTTETDFGYGDDGNAWSPATEDGQREYLELGFDTLQTVHTIEIYETWYPGSIDTVYIRHADSQQWEIIYSKPAITDLPEEARIFAIYLNETSYLIDAIRLAINSPEVEGWNEIDAVAIRGQRENK